MIQSFSKKRVSDSNLNEYIESQKIHNKRETDKKLIPVNYQLRKSEKASQEEKRLFIETLTSSPCAVLWGQHQSTCHRCYPGARVPQDTPDILTF